MRCQGSVFTSDCIYLSVRGSMGSFGEKMNACVFLKTTLGVQIWNLGTPWKVCDI